MKIVLDGLKFEDETSMKLLFYDKSTIIALPKIIFNMTRRSTLR